MIVQDNVLILEFKIFSNNINKLKALKEKT